MRRHSPIAAVAGIAALLVLAAGGESAAWAKCRVVGTKTQPACTLSVPSQYNAYLLLPAGYTGSRSVSSPATYAGIESCAQHFVVQVDGEGRWSRLTVQPPRQPVHPGPISAAQEEAIRECDCLNMEAEVTVRALSEISHCEGGCGDCSLADYCANPGACYECSWTPTPLGSFPHRTKTATGVWVAESARTGPAHCTLQVQFFRNSSSPSWAGKGAVVAAVVWDKRTGDLLPLSVSARYSESDPAVMTGGCPSCPD
jgi:hypothetical protein